MPDKISYLLQRYLHDQLTELEYNELAALLKHDPDDRRLTELLQQIGINQPLEPGYDRNRWQPLVDAILHQHNIPEEIAEGIECQVPSVIRRRGRHWWAAAAILVGISIGTYFFVQNRAGVLNKVAATPVNTDITPGGNRAVLTLGNGSKIILDSAHNGLLAQQGNTSIIKTDSGKLDYHTSTGIALVPSYNTMATPRGGQFQLTMSDGTKVWLNAASSITYPTAFVGKERKVIVTGEAYFEVVHSSKMPFRVKVNDQVIEDIGTSFNVNAYPDEQSVKTTLIEGSVSISNEKQNKILLPGQQSISKEVEMHVINDVNLAQVIAWKNGLFDFNNMKLETAMRQLSRWYDIEVLYEKGIPDIEFGGTLKQNLNLQSLLHVLEVSGVHFRIEPGRKLIVLPE